MVHRHQSGLSQLHQAVPDKVGTNHQEETHVAPQTTYLHQDRLELVLDYGPEFGTTQHFHLDSANPDKNHDGVERSVLGQHISSNLQIWPYVFANLANPLLLDHPRSGPPYTDRYQLFDLSTNDGYSSHEYIDALPQVHPKTSALLVKINHPATTLVCLEDEKRHK